MTELIKFPKIPRLVNTQITITEKIGGIGAQLFKVVFDKCGPSPEES